MIKMAQLVNLRDSGLIDFEIRIRRRILCRRELFIKCIGPINNSSHFGFEKNFLLLLTKRNEIRLNFRIPHTIGFGVEEKIVMDQLANKMNQELMTLGYLERANGKWLPITNKVKALESESRIIKSRLSEFQHLEPDLYKLISANL
jgi:hypothetical protein